MAVHNFGTQKFLVKLFFTRIYDQIMTRNYDHIFTSGKRWL